MPFLIEDIVSTVTWLIIIGLSLSALFALVTIQRRITRHRYFQRLDYARSRVQELLEPFYQQNGNVEALVASLQAYRAGVERTALEDVLLRHTKVPEHLALTRRIVQKLGWIREWSDLLRSHIKKPSEAVVRVLANLGDHYRSPNSAGKLRLWLEADFMERCRSANKLSQVPTPEGLLAMLAATDDPHVDVKEVCVANLGRLGDPATLPVLVEELIKVLEGHSPLSIRVVKTALVSFQLEDVDAFLPALEHPHRRVRFLATDAVREIVNRRAAHELLSKNDFSPQMHQFFLERLSRDEFPDVRARATVVISHFHHNESNSALERLIQDEAWFVRMHACRAAGGKYFLPLAPAVARCITDKQWQVREAAVRCLRDMGEVGVEHITREFLTVTDRYAAEQICEEIQRSKILTDLLAGIEEPRQFQMATMVTRKMVSLGKIAMLMGYLMSPVGPAVKLMLITELSQYVTPELLEALRVCAEADPHPQVRTAALDLFQSGTGQIRAASGTFPGATGAN